MKFKDLKISEKTVDALHKIGIEDATEVQVKAIPLILENHDVIARSKTGSGKTFAFGIPIIERLDNTENFTQVLIISPTRELASQICDELRKIVTSEGTKVVPVYGGTDIQKQIGALKRNSRIVVGTPGRIMDHLKRKTLKLNNLKTLVLDEADEMLNMGFKEDIETILKSTNKTHQTIMFSATMPKEISALAKTYMKNPLTVEVSENNNYEIKQYYLTVGLREKYNALNHLLKTFSPRLSIVFCNTKRQVDELSSKFKDSGYNIFALHGDMRQSQRKKIMQGIKDVNTSKNQQNITACNVLIATDVAARGLDIKKVDMIFNYDIPNSSDYYTHRIGRTGRAGNTGIAYNIINNANQLRLVHEFAKINKSSIEEYKCDLTVEYKSSGRSKSSEGSFSNFKKNARVGFDRKPRFDRDASTDKGSRFERKPRFDRDANTDKGSRFDRKPRFDRDANTDKGSRFDRKPRFDRDANASKENRFDRKPRFDRDANASKENKFDRKPRFDRDANASKENRFDRKPRFDKDASTDKGSRFDRKPRFDKDTKFDKTAKFSKESKYGKDTRFNKDSKLNKDTKFAKDTRFSKDSRPSKRTGLFKKSSFNKKSKSD